MIEELQELVFLQIGFESLLKYQWLPRRKQINLKTLKQIVFIAKCKQ